MHYYLSRRFPFQSVQSPGNEIFTCGISSVRLVMPIFHSLFISMFTIQSCFLVCIDRYHVPTLLTFLFNTFSLGGRLGSADGKSFSLVWYGASYDVLFCNRCQVFVTLFWLTGNYIPTYKFPFFEIDIRCSLLKQLYPIQLYLIQFGFSWKETYLSSAVSSFTFCHQISY